MTDLMGLVFSLSDLSVENDGAGHGGMAPVPLQAVKISAEVIEFVSEVTIEQRSVNIEDRPIEVTYHFPIEEEAAVVGFEATIEGKTIVADIRSKAEARQEYEDALRDRNTAILMEEKIKDVLQIKLGQLMPGSGAVIKIRQLGELPVVEGDKIALTIPTTIFPRYVPPTAAADEAGRTIASLTYSLESPAKLDFQVKASFQTAVDNIQCVSHPHIEFLPTSDSCSGSRSGGQKVATYTNNSRSTIRDMDRDMIVHIRHQSMDKPWLLVEKKGNHSVAMLSMVPNFKLHDHSIEAAFVVDRSGSMHGFGMARAKEAMALFLHSLPSGSLFNIWSFGSHHSSLFPQSQLYNDQTLAEAKAHVDQMEANFGGTEILEPLRDIFSQKQTSTTHYRQVFLLTDGGVSNSAQVIDLVAQEAGPKKTRIFTLGIGPSASRHLVKGVARAGQGTAIFAAGSNDDLRPKVMALLKNAMQPAFANIQVDWKVIELNQTKTFLGYNKPITEPSRNSSSSSEIEPTICGQVPSQAPPIFDGSRLLLYYFLPSSHHQLQSVTISGDSPSDGKLETSLTFSDTGFLPEGSDMVIKLAARKKVQSLEEENPNHWHNNNKDAIEKIGLEFGIMTSQTSFVGVDKETRKPIENQVMVRRQVANQTPYMTTFYAQSAYAYAPIRLRGGGGGETFYAQGAHACAPIRLRGGGGGETFYAQGANACAAAAGQGAPIRLTGGGGGEPIEKRQRKRQGVSCSAKSRRRIRKEKRARSPENAFEDCSAMDEGDHDGISDKDSNCKDLVTKIIDLQTSSGAFTWGHALQTLLEMDRGQVEKVKPLGSDMDCWLTTLVVCLIKSSRKITKDERSLLDLVTRKAEVYLRQRDIDGGGGGGGATDPGKSSEACVMEAAIKIVAALQ